MVIDIQINPLFLSVIRLAITFIFYAILFLFLIGITSQITVDELNFFENSFAKFPLINKVITFLSTIEKTIINLRVKKKNKN